MWARKILDNEDWLVTVGPLGGVRATDKVNGTYKKGTAAQNAFFHRAIRRLQDHGIPIEPKNEIFEKLVGRMCVAIVYPESPAARIGVFSTGEPEIMVDAMLELEEANR